MICNILKYIWFTPIIVTQNSYQYSCIHHVYSLNKKSTIVMKKKTQVTFSSANMKWYTNTWIAQVMLNTLGYKHLLRGTKWGGGNLLPTDKNREGTDPTSKGWGAGWGMRIDVRVTLLTFNWQNKKNKYHREMNKKDVMTRLNCVVIVMTRGTHIGTFMEEDKWTRQMSNDDVTCTIQYKKKKIHFSALMQTKKIYGY